MSPTTQTLLIILIGVATVVGGVLLLKLHAFLALISAAIVVALITPTAFVEQAHVNKPAIVKKVLSASAEGLVLKADDVEGWRDGTLLQVIRFTDAASPEILGLMRLKKPAEGIPVAVPEGDLAVSSLITSAGELEGPVFVAEPTAVSTALTNARKTIGERIAVGFGNTAASIGILIAMAAIVGQCLLESGAADKIVRTAIRWFGVPFAPLAFLLTGFLLGIPVFFDTVFLLMVPLAKAMHLRTKKDYLVYVMSIICGGTMSHSLVPPTPGPLYIQDAFDVNMGTMIIVGSIFSLLSGGVGYLFAVFMNRIRPLELRDSPECPLDKLEETAAIDESQLPPFWLAIMPIALPVVLITGWSVIDETGWLTGTPARIAATLGDKNISLTISAVIALGMQLWIKRQSLGDLTKSLEGALASAGMIILITSAGGAFGGVLQETGVANVVRDLGKMPALALVAIAWAISAALRGAQGSATVSMITCAGIFAPLAFSPDLPFHKVYLAMAIATGSKPFSWMNDSGFWVMSKMSGMTEKEGLLYVTTLTTVLGIAGLVWVLLGVALFPMVPGTP